MGSGESTTRKVSFGVDDEDRVRILRGVKLSEDVLQRMRGVANIPPSRTAPPSSVNPKKDPGSSTTPSPSPRRSPQPQQTPQHRAWAEPSTKTNMAKSSDSAKDEQKRFERQQTILQEELAKVARREREANREEMTKALNRERLYSLQEVDKAQQLVKQMQKKDAELKALDGFYKEQLAILEMRNMERFKQSSEQFNQAAAKSEANVRPRSTEPVCPVLQSQILSCYKDNGQETLRCSELAKEYMRCINIAKKNLLVNHG